MNRSLSRACIALVVLASQSGLAADSPAAAGFGYRPDGMMMWDTWFVEDHGQVHMFHLQHLAPGSKRSALEADHIGHAVSRDLIHWTEQPLTVGPGAAGGLDDMPPWTGCAVAREGTCHLFYTMRSSRENARCQRIGLATSRDFVHWSRHPLNPLIRPDARWYVHEDKPEPGSKVGCRDLVVVRDPSGDGWLGFYAATVPAEEEAEGACIAAVRSRDLIHWEHLPPVFQPKRYGEVEVPDVFRLGGKWWMTCLTSHGHGNRGGFADPHVVKGTICAVADRPEGPYREPAGDNIVFGGDDTGGISLRSVEFAGKRYAFFTEGPRLSPPMELGVARDGRLRLLWSERQNAWRGAAQLGTTPPAPTALRTHGSGAIGGGRWELTADGTYRGIARTGWQVGDLSVGATNMEVEASLTLVSGVAAGLVVRADRQSPQAAGDFVIGLDAKDRCAFATRLPMFFPANQRAFPLELGRAYRLRLYVRDERYELFVDDALVLQGAFPAAFRRTDASLGLLVDRGEAVVERVGIYRQDPRGKPK
jgi:beta-fructofuranosidase